MRILSKLPVVAPIVAPVAPVVVNLLPEYLNIGELLEDIKNLIATIRKQGRRIAQLKQAAKRRRKVSYQKKS